MAMVCRILRLYSMWCEIPLGVLGVLFWSNSIICVVIPGWWPQSEVSSKQDE